MGKWTPNYTDDVLHAKISNLVSGSIRRAAVEKEPSITYENFVDDMDTGDSFTASLVDILVKELADRRTRTNAADRRLIAERTIRGLRMLASNSRSFPSRLGRPRPRRLTEYFTASPNELEVDEEEDEYEVAMENPTTIEGARINSDLYDAFAPAEWGVASTHRATESPPVSEEWLPPLTRPPNWTATHATASTSGTQNLTRQPSIRRQRSRMVDFHEYAHRRRSNVRESLARSEPPESVTEPREAPTTGATVRRFFPFPRPRRSASTVNPRWSEVSDTLSLDSDEPPSVQYYVDSPSAGWFLQNPVPNPLRVSPDAESREEIENLLPRLRRGGFRTHESVLSRRVSPVPIAASPIPIPSAVTSSSIPESAASQGQAPSSPRPDGSTSTSTPAIEEPVAYPTPGSTENENLA